MLGWKMTLALGHHNRLAFPLPLSTHLGFFLSILFDFFYFFPPLFSRMSLGTKIISIFLERGGILIQQTGALQANLGLTSVVCQQQSPLRMVGKHLVLMPFFLFGDAPNTMPVMVKHT